jgi:hypothetical protein
VDAGMPAGVPAGDYTLTVTGLAAKTTATYGSLTQRIAGGGAQLRNDDFYATTTPQTVTADVRVKGPTDVFNILSKSPVSWTGMSLSAAILDYVVRGSQITSPTSGNVLFHGVNTPPLQDTDYATMFALEPAITSVRTVIDEEFWDPFFTTAQVSAPCAAFRVNGQTAAVSYQARITQAVNDITSAGRIAILGLDDAGRDTPTWMPGPQTDLFGPDQQSLVVYQQLATQFGSNPLVMFETTNEPKMLPGWTYGPNKVTGQVLWQVGGTNTQKGMTWNEPGAQQIVNTIRAAGSNNVIMVQTFSWGENLVGVKTNPIAGTNLAYSFHGYRAPDQYTTYPPTWNAEILPYIGPAGIYNYAGVLSEFGTIQQDMLFPVGSAYLQSCINWVAHYGFAWIANAWYPTNYGDKYGLLATLRPVVLNSKGQTVARNL